MQKISSYICLPLFFFLFFLPPASMSSQVDKNASKVESILETAKLIMKAAKYCFLITLDESGHPTARIMDPFDPESAMKIWMGTNKNTRKVEQIKKDTRATLAYYDAESMGYVTLIGKARLVTDPMLKEKWWKEEWNAFYPGGKESEVYSLIEFSPFRIEVMDISRKVLVSLFRPEIVTLKDSVWIHEK
jgi:general stress protein 26